MILLTLLVVVTTGYSRCTIFDGVNLDSKARQDTSISIRQLRNDESNPIKENGRENGKLTRHIKLLEQQFQEKCGNVQSKECEQMLEKLINAKARKKKKSHFFRNAFTGLDLRFCLDGLEVVRFDPDTQLCCNGVFNKTTNNEECCQGEIIDNTEQLCCNEDIHNRTAFESCCGTYTYDLRLKTCCGGNLYTKSPGTSCCGGYVYNKETEVCCFDRQTFDLSDGDKCCGTSVYNSSTHACCYDTIQPAFGKNNRNGGCCKDKSYHATCYTCEHNAIVPLYNESTSICCDGKIRDKKHGNDTICCGRQVIHSTKHRCFYDKKKSRNGISFLDKDGQTFAGVKSTSSVFVSVPKNHTKKMDKKTISIIVIVSSSFIVLVTIVGVLCKYWMVKRLCWKNMSEVNSHDRYAYNGLNPSITDDEHPIIDNLHNVSNTYRLINTNVNDPRETTTADVYRTEYKIMNEDISSGQYTFDNRILVHDNLLSNISKEGRADVPTENELMFYSKDTFTQTCPEKETNRRTIFGLPFDHNFNLGESNATAEMPNSDVKMTLPVNVLKCEKIEVNSTSFTSIGTLRKKLGLTNDRALASPVVEYALTGNRRLSEHAVVLLPFIGNPDHLEVRKFESDEGLNTVVKSINVPKQTKVNEDMDVFYILKDSHVYVYTKSFSGFYCTTMRHRSMRLRCFLFGSYKRFVDPLRHEVRVMVYIADELMKFADYKERMLTNESAGGRVLKKEMLLKVPHQLTDTDIVQFAITPTESHCNQWMHKLYPGTSDPIYDEIQRVELYHIAEKCKDCEHCHLPEHDIPHCIEWYMTNVQNVIPSYTFQCIVDIDVHKSATDSKTSNRIVIDELQLRQEDRDHVQDPFNTRNVQGIKEYLASRVTPVERENILTALSSKYNCPGRSVDEVFFKLQEKLTPRYVLEALTALLKEKQMFKHLDCLQAWEYIPSNFVCTDIQAVNDDTEIAPGEHSPVTVNNDYSNNTMTPTNAIQLRENLIEAAQATESHKVPKTSPNTPQRDNQMVRQELSHATLGVEDNALNGIKDGREILEIRGELSTRLRHSDSKDETSNAPVQEHASLDETHLKI